MVLYKLIYFNFRLRGEVIRFIFHQAGVAFEDFRFEPKDFATIKQTIPFGRVPVLEVDGQQLYQTKAICRYLAAEFGLAGKDNWERAQVDMYADCLDDLLEGLRQKVIKGVNDVDKENKNFKLFNQETIQPHLKIVENQLIKNSSGFLVGDLLTWADLTYFAFLEGMQMRFAHENIMEDHPHVQKLVDTIAALPNLKKYLETRPVTAL